MAANGSRRAVRRGEPIRVLLAASEVVGFAKTGGLADVAGSLPPALVRRGCDAAVILPLYHSRRTGRIPVEPTGHVFHVPVAGKSVEGRVWRLGPARFQRARLPDRKRRLLRPRRPGRRPRPLPVHGAGRTPRLPRQLRPLLFFQPGRPRSRPPARLLARRAPPQRLADRPGTRLPARVLPPLHRFRRRQVQPYSHSFYHPQYRLSGRVLALGHAADRAGLAAVQPGGSWSFTASSTSSRPASSLPTC